MVTVSHFIVFPPKRVAISQGNKVSLSEISHPWSRTSYSCWRRRVKVCAFHPNISWSGGLRRFHRIHRVSSKSVFLSKSELRRVIPIHKSSDEKARWSSHSGEIYVVFPWAARHGQLWDSIVEGEKDLSPFGGWKEEGWKWKKKKEKSRDPASGAVRLQEFLASDWFQKGKNYSANTTIISCLATAH